MDRAFELAALGLGHVSPNPLVGCVIVKDGTIVGEGYHMKYGESHAEVNAINSVKDKSLLEGAEIYVTLEPCTHYGKTPPCVDLIMKYGFQKVIIANEDPNPIVAGKGIRKLIDSGYNVVTGVNAEMGKRINRRFFTNILKKRPYIILKWAQTADGYIARENYESKWISNPYSRMLVHKWRAEEDAIMVGTKTAAYDNPSLTVREWEGRNPVRIVIDKDRSLDPSLNLFDRREKTICFNIELDKEEENISFIKLNDDENFLLNVFENLLPRNIGSVLVEGGTALLQSLIKSNLYDEIRVFKCPVQFSAGIKAPQIPLHDYSTDEILKDQLYIYLRKEVGL